MATSWADIYHKWVDKGMDHSYAAHMADEWQKRDKSRLPTIYCGDCGKEGHILLSGYPTEGWVYLVLDDVGGGDWLCPSCQDNRPF